MSTGATASLTIRLRDLASAPLRAMGKGITSTMGGIKKAAAQTKKSFDLAGQMSLAASGMSQLKGQLDDITQGPVNEFKAFEFQMVRVGQLSGDLANNEFEQLKQKAISLGESTFFTGMEAAQGLEQLAVAGFNAQQQLEAIQPVLRLSQASGADLGRTADIASDLLGGFGLKASDTAHLTDVLTATFTNSTTTLEGLFEAFKLSGPIATQAGISMEKLAVATGVLGNAGIKGSMGGTAMRGMLLGLTNPSKKARKTLNKLGLTAKFVAANLSDPLVLMKKLGESMKDMSAPERLATVGKAFNARQAGPVGILVDAMADGAAGADKLSEAITNSTGLTERFGLAMENTATGRVKLLESQISKLRLELGEGMLPVQESFMEVTRDTVKWLGAWNKESPKTTGALAKLAVGLGGVLAIAIPLTFAISSMITLWGLVGPMFLGAVMPIGSLIAKISVLQGTLAAYGTTATTVAAGSIMALGGMAAAFVGWKIGETIDGWIGKLFDLRGELLSTELALQGGESTFFNGLVKDAGEALSDPWVQAALALTGVGIPLAVAGAMGAGDELVDIADGNIRRNQSEAVAVGAGRDSAEGLQDAQKGLDFGKSTVKIELSVDAQGNLTQTAVKTDDTKGPALDVGKVAS